MKNLFWKLLYPCWKNRGKTLVPGYTVILPVPGDMPFFTVLAINACRAQKDSNMKELLLVPDHIPVELEEFYNKVESAEADVPCRIVKMSAIDYLLAKHCGNSQRHWIQIFNATKLVSTTRLLFHDCDLFPENEDFFAHHYLQSVANDFHVYGVSKVWDPWFKENGYSHITATWEAMITLQWIHAFPPSKHRGQDAVLEGKQHVFDTLLLPQCLTAPDRIGHSSKEENFVHFNYVVCTYRNYQKTDENFLDPGFKLLLIRLLIDLFDESGWSYNIPPIETLCQHLVTRNGRIIFPDKDDSDEYIHFRNKLGIFMDLDLINSKQRNQIIDRISIFDNYYRFERQD